MDKRVIGFCFLSLLNQSGLAETQNTLFGERYDRHEQISHYSVITNDAQNHWQGENQIENFPRHAVPNFDNATCTGKQCISVGYRGDINKGKPILMTSQDGGTNWAQVKYIKGISTQVNHLRGRLVHVTCYEKYCLATGLIKNTAGDDAAYSAIISEDGGLNWSAPLKQMEKAPFFEKAYCIKDRCVAMSRNKLYLSKNKGKEWELIPLDLVDLTIWDLKTSGQQFIAVGSYAKGVGKPLIIVSKDSGQHWDIKFDKVSNEINTFYILACNTTACIAAGGHGALPFTMRSTDSGLTWQTLKTPDKAPQKAISFTLGKAVCTDKACAIVGSFHLPNGLFPLLTTVDLYEKKNEYHVISTPLNNYFDLYDINCGKTKCYAVGNEYHYDDFDKKSAPILLTSDASLRYWQDSSDKQFPVGYDDRFLIRAIATPN